MCFVCHVKKKNSKFCDLETQHSDLERSGWEHSSPPNSLAGSFSSRDALLSSRKLAADVRELVSVLHGGKFWKSYALSLPHFPSYLGFQGERI